MKPPTWPRKLGQPERRKVFLLSFPEHPKDSEVTYNLRHLHKYVLALASYTKKLERKTMELATAHSALMDRVKDMERAVTEPEKLG